MQAFCVRAEFDFELGKQEARKSSQSLATPQRNAEAGGTDISVESVHRKPLTMDKTRLCSI